MDDQFTKGLYPDNKSTMNQTVYRKIPAIGGLLKDEEVASRFQSYPQKMVLEAMREVADQWRRRIKSKGTIKADLSREAFLVEVEKILKQKGRRSLKRVINATGVILNTNLGRAPLASDAIAALSEVSSGYSNLEIQLETGQRGERYTHVDELLQKLTGAESALVVNNNAAAVLLILDTFAKDKEVIVSRGELIEIGGSFRLPEVLKKSGAKLIEVGTTNRTYLSDYEDAINENTALLFRSHTSNYKIIGFTHRPILDEFVRLGKRHDVITVEDLGGGLLVDLTKFGLPYEPTVGDAVKSGLDLITFSGDKLLGGPQCGIILGKEDLIKKMKKNPLLRALRVCKLTLGALEAILRIYYYEEDPGQKIPHLRMITEPLSTIKRKADRLARRVGSLLTDGFKIEIIEGKSEVGGGSYPGVEIPTYLMSLRSDNISSVKLAKSLRKSDPPVITRIADDRVLFDLRTIREEEIPELIKAIKQALPSPWV